MSYNHFNSLRMQSAHKHDQNTYLDLFVCNCPIKHILCISISRLWSQWELLAEKCCAFKLQGAAMWAMFRVGKKSGPLPKCCTIKREEVGFHILKASKGFSSAVECGCNHHTHLRRDYSRLSTTHLVSLSHFPFTPVSVAPFLSSF